MTATVCQMWTKVNKPITNKYTAFRNYSCFPNKKKRSLVYKISLWNSHPSGCTKHNICVLQGKCIDFESHTWHGNPGRLLYFVFLICKQSWVQKTRVVMGLFRLKVLHWTRLWLQHARRDILRANQMWKSTKFHTFRTSFPPQAQMRHQPARSISRASF